MFYSCRLFGHAEGKKVANLIIEELKTGGAHIKDFAALGSKGRNVKKIIFTAIDSPIKESGFSCLIQIGAYNLYITPVFKYSEI